ncbi:hypothetical protein CHS0354_039066 [Potamilus streckersoni]|uniref:Uncharacterized protein n=1 Tax=Potamilus streckersoni TaxID=2493646 RepID=A0AAE0VIV1_9BIVA|nr:hypothetical protein CHS0354_039066 [Potamilus streckersoni]
MNDRMVKVLFFLIAVTHAAKVQRRGLERLDDFSIQTFTTLFREALLAQIATEWNHTLELGKVLHLKMGDCQTQINTEGDQCKACAKSSCSSSNTQAAVDQKVDILSILLNPLKILEGPLSVIGDTLHNVVDLLGNGGKTFVNSMANLVNTAGHTVTDGFSTALSGLKNGVDAVGHFFTDTGNTLLGGFHTIGSTAENLAGGIKDGLGTLGSTLASVGQTIGNGLSTVGQTIGNGVSSLLDAGKGLLGSKLKKKRHNLNIIRTSLSKLLKQKLLCGEVRCGATLYHIDEENPFWNNLERCDAVLAAEFIGMVFNATSAQRGYVESRQTMSYTETSNKRRLNLVYAGFESTLFLPQIRHAKNGSSTGDCIERHINLIIPHAACYMMLQVTSYYFKRDRQERERETNS